MSIDVHPTALVAKGAELADGVSVGPFSIIGEHVRIGARTQILAHVVIEGHTRIGEDCSVRNFSNSVGIQAWSAAVTPGDGEVGTLN